MTTPRARAAQPVGSNRPSHTGVSLYPLRFAPIFKRLIWGGRRLETVLGKTLGPGDDYAESWEIADHGDDVSRVVNGPLRGCSLRELLRTHPDELLGPSEVPPDGFPLLVKFLDAHRDLSVQVHPDDARGRRLAGDRGKTEAWVVLDAAPGSLIYAGLQAGVDRPAFEEALRFGTVADLLHRVPARPGDCLFIPAGTIHALGAGVLVAEVQQMSDATFRVHDWDRLGPDGEPRALHIAEALESTDFDLGPVEPVRSRPEPHAWGTREQLVACPYFVLERYRVDAATEIGSPDRFTILVGLDGAAEVAFGTLRFVIRRGETLLLPASAGRLPFLPMETATVLSCTVP
jgi:mannose-6-phosphate isomerase